MSTLHDRVIIDIGEMSQFFRVNRLCAVSLGVEFSLCVFVCVVYSTISSLRRGRLFYQLFALNDPDTPILLHRSSGSRSSPDISFALSTLAFSCSWEVLQDLGSDHLPILLSIPLSPVFCPNERPPSFNFQKARWDGFASYFDSHCSSAEEYSSLSLSSAAALFTSLTLNVAKSSIPFGRIKRPPKAWWSAEVEEAVSERRKAFAAANRSDEDRQACISTSRCASSVIAKAKTEAWQTTCSSLSPRSNPKSVHSLLRSIAGSSSSSPNFPNCSSPRKLASVYAVYLRSHFPISQPKALRSRARGYLTELRRATCSEESLFLLLSFLSRRISCGCLQSYPIHCQWPRQSCLFHAKAPSSLWHGFSSLNLQSFLVFTFLSFHLEDIFHYSHTQDGKASRLSCFLQAYLSHLLRIKAV